MTKPKPADIGPVEIHPGHVYRVSLASIFFGLGPDQVRRKILSDELPPPHRPTPTSKVLVWTGEQIIAHRKKMEELAAKELAAERVNPREQPAQLAKIKDRPRGKSKKVKLLQPPRT